MTNAGENYILIVEDDEDTRAVLRRFLERKGYVIQAVSNGYEALDLVEEEQFDLILLDILMPGISGLEVLKVLRQQYSHTDLPIVMASSVDRSMEIVEAFDQGANDYVTKPFDLPVVHARIKTQLALRRLSELKDEFLRIASHNLKNPLTVILGISELLGKKVHGDEESLLMLEKITKRTTEMQYIIEDFLDFQALQDGKLVLLNSDVDVNAVAADVIESNREYAAEKGITLETQLDPALPVLHGDGTHLAQVIRNMISNAVKFCPPGSTATIRTRRERKHVVVEVIDTGPGLTDQDLKKVFRKYARLSNKPTGGEKSSGLGLAICKEMIDMHGGEIGARNNNGGGATFWFRLRI